MNAKEYIPLTCEVLVVTEKAALVHVPDVATMQFWIPLSLCEAADTIAEDDEEIRVQRWWLEQEGLI